MDSQTYLDTLESLQLRLQEVEDNYKKERALRRTLEDVLNREKQRQQIATQEAMKKKVIDTNRKRSFTKVYHNPKKVSEEEMLDNPNAQVSLTLSDIGAYHLLLKHVQFNTRYFVNKNGSTMTFKHIAKLIKRSEKQTRAILKKLADATLIEIEDDGICEYYKLNYEFAFSGMEDVEAELHLTNLSELPNDGSRLPEMGNL